MISVDLEDVCTPSTPAPGKRPAAGSARPMALPRFLTDLYDRFGHRVALGFGDVVVPPRDDLVRDADGGVRIASGAGATWHYDEATDRITQRQDVAPSAVAHDWFCRAAHVGAQAHLHRSEKLVNGRHVPRPPPPRPDADGLGD